LLEIQNQLFVVGAEIARSPKVKLEAKALTKLEKASSSLQQKMVKNWSSKFLYPGGNQVAAFTDVARTVSRRFERLVVRYSGEQAVSPLILQYVNRLSDYLYVLRCFINHEEHYHEVQFIAEK
jgi:cob(I)alamin adenosyltransferase